MILIDSFKIFDFNITVCKVFLNAQGMKVLEAKVTDISYTYDDRCTTTYHHQLLTKPYSYSIYDVLNIHSLMTN